MTRIFYCPKCGRVEERNVDPFYTECEICLQWYSRTVRFKAKRAGES